jgi:predicted pyridoxine 5'-phosphate oxidase superfamily flavin-nucleotide-binding protein
MNSHFLQLATTPAVEAAQVRYQGRVMTDRAPTDPDVLGPVEREFIASRDTFYLASVTESGWPYVQHRGGPAGFLQVLSPTTLAFADVRGNRQMLTTGNVSSNDRVALILMDYPQRSRLKILGQARVTAASEDPQLAARLKVEGLPPAERIVRIEVVAFDWNCPKYITPRFTRAEVDELVAPLRAEIEKLRRDLAVARRVS